MTTRTSKAILGTGAVLALAAAVLLASSCGGSSDSGGGTTPPPVKGVTISPSTATVSRGGTKQFTASVSGTTDQSVSWEVAGVRGGDSVHGRISLGGVYIAPTTVPSPATVSVTAVSLVDPTKKSTATVTVQAGSTVGVVISAGASPVVVPTFGSRAFTASVSGTANTAVTWQVNGVTGGAPATGTISADGTYYAPHSAPVSTAANNRDQTTDVIVTAVSQADTAASCSVIVLPVPPQQGRFPLPVPLGTSGGNVKDKSTKGSLTFCCSGTIGGLLSRGGRLFVLSNNHVLARSDLAAAGEGVVQPGLVDAGCSPSATSTVATLTQFFDLENGTAPKVDAAMAEIVSGAVEPLGTILQLGGTASGGQPTDGTPNPGPGVAPTIGREVAKSGSATGLTCGSIMAINVSASVEYQKGCNTGTTFTVSFARQIDIGGVGFSAQGDSGSLIVTQDTADPVGLLFSGSDTDTVANPVANVLSQLADPGTGELPVFVGDASVGAHPVAACSIPQPSALPAPGVYELAVESGAWQTAVNARDAHADELLALPGVLALGVGASYDSPGEPAVLIFVAGGYSRPQLPAELDGVRTRVIETDVAAKRGLLSTEESRVLGRSAAPERLASPISEAETERAIRVQEVREGGFMGRRGIQGVGVSSSLDAPGEAALMIFTIRGVEHDPIPAVVDGLRTRVRESNRFRAK